MSNLKKRKEEYIPTTIGENWCYENGYEQGKADERAKAVKEIGNECSDKDLNENIDWCIQTLSLFDVTDLNKKELCETLESQKAMIVMHDTEVRNKTIEECFKAMRQKVDEVFQRQTEERHEKDLSAYQQPFDCFSMGTIELEILGEVENQMKEQK